MVLLHGENMTIRPEPRRGPAGRGTSSQAELRPRRAIILAAGQGLRLLPHTRQTPKCLLDLGGRTVLQNQLEVLRSAGIEEAVVVVGYHAEAVRRSVTGPARFVENPDYASTNSIYSLWLARRFLDRPCLVMNGDVVFGSDVLQKLLDCPLPDVVVYDSQSGQDPEETKVRLAWHGRLVNIGKSIPASASQGEYLGLLRLSQGGARQLAQVLERMVGHGRVVSDWVPAAVRRMLHTRPVFAADVAGRPWIEIDFREDLERARNEVYPRLCGTTA